MSAHLETEIKLRITNRDALRGALRRLDARPSGRVLERNTLFDTADSDLRRRKRLLRLRIETPAGSPEISAGRPRAMLTSKQPAPASAPSGYKHNLESESRIALDQNWLAALGSVGFLPGFRYEKFRSRVRIPRAIAGAVQLDLDETPIGTFLEIEGAPEAIDRVARALGFLRRDYLRATYADLYAARCRRRGQIPRNMLFPP